MSRVIRPSGPLPPRVYWTRRLLLVAVAILVISLIWWVLGRISGSAEEPTAGPSADAPASGGHTSAETDETDSATPPHPGNGGRNQGRQNPGGKNHEDTPDRPPPVPAEPTGDCDPEDVAMNIVVSDAPSGKPNPADLVFTSLGTPACTLAISPGSLVLRVTSGSDVVWSSDDCPDDVLAKEIVVRQDPPTTYRFTWNGHRSTDSCREPGGVALPGGYWVEAALVGADAHKGFFDVTDE